MRIRDNPASRTCCDHRDLRHLCETSDLDASLGPERAAPGDDDRPLGRRKRSNRGTNVGGITCGACWRDRETFRNDVQRSGVPVHGMSIQLEVHGAGAPGSGAMQRLGNVPRNSTSIRAGRRPLRDRCRDRALVDVTDGASSLPVAACPAREHHERDTPGSRVEQADEAVRKSRAGRHRSDTRLPGCQRPPLSGEHGRPLVPGVDDPDVLVARRIEKWQDMAAGKGENRGHAAFPESARYQRTAVGALLGVGARSLGRDVSHGFRSVSTGIGGGHCDGAWIE